MSDVAVTFGAKDEGLAKAFKSVGDSSKSLGDTFKTLLVPLAAIGGAFLALRKMAGDFKAAIDMGGRLNDLSARTGETAGNLLLLERAFENAGAGADAVGAVLNKMQRFMVEASQKGGEQAKTMERLGLSFEELSAKSPLEQLRAVAAKIAEMPDPAERSAAAMQVLGRSGGELIPLFRAMGVELDTAKAQLGSAPAIIDRANQALDTIGDNMGAIAEKSKEFALGLLSELLPGIVAVTDRLATLDAAGVGAKLSEYARATMDWVSETFKLSDALKSIELAFQAITSGEVGDGLKLIFLTARDTALNAINEIWAGISAMFQTVLGSASELLSFDGPIFSVVVNAVSFLGKHIELTLSKSILAAIPDIEMFGGAIRDLETNIGALPYEIAAMESRLGTSTKAAVEAIGEEFASLPERFSENYDKNIKDPLFQMEERMAETAEHAAKIEESLENAFKTGDHSPIPQWLSDSINAPAPVTEQPPVEQVPDTGKSLGVSASGSGPAERQMSAREKSMIESRMRRADEYERKGFFSSAERERQAAESTIARSRQREALRAVQKDRNLQGGSTMTPEEIARRSGFSDLNKEKFDAEVEKIKGQIAARAGQGDGTEAGPAGRSKSEPTQSPLEKLVSEIKTLVAKIEPKLPVSALTA